MERGAQRERSLVELPRLDLAVHVHGTRAGQHLAREKACCLVYVQAPLGEDFKMVAGTPVAGGCSKYAELKRWA